MMAKTTTLSFSGNEVCIVEADKYNLILQSRIRSKYEERGGI
jgi:hypothetical protein